jgi:hypothetical protein
MQKIQFCETLQIEKNGSYFFGVRTFKGFRRNLCKSKKKSKNYFEIWDGDVFEQITLRNIEIKLKLLQNFFVKHAYFVVYSEFFLLPNLLSFPCVSRFIKRQTKLLWSR